MSIISVVIFLAIGITIMIAFMNLTSIMDAVQEESPSETQDPFSEAINMIPFGLIFDILIVIGCFGAVALFTKIFVIDTNLINKLKKQAKLNKQEKFYRKYPELRNVIKLAKLPTTEIRPFYPTVNEMLQKVKIDFDKVNFKQLEVTIEEYLHEIHLLHVIQESEGSLPDKAKYFEELETTMVNNITKEKVEYTDELLELEMYTYRRLNETEDKLDK